MIQPLEQVAQQISKTDQQLMYHLIIEQRETNRLLRLMLENKQELPDEHKPSKRGRKPREEKQ